MLELCSVPESSKGWWSFPQGRGVGFLWVYMDLFSHSSHFLIYLALSSGIPSLVQTASFPQTHPIHPVTCSYRTRQVPPHRSAIRKPMSGWRAAGESICCSCEGPNFSSSTHIGQLTTPKLWLLQIWDSLLVPTSTAHMHKHTHKIFKKYILKRY